MMGFKEWMKRNAEQTKIAKNRPVSDLADAELEDRIVKDIVGRIMARVKQNRQPSPIATM